MCQFNYITLPEEADVAAVRNIARNFGKKLDAVSDHALLPFLNAGESLYATTATGCDCGSCVGCGSQIADPAGDNLERDARKLAANGWSAGKIARWRTDKAATALRDERLRRQRLEDRADEARAWCNLIRSAVTSATPWIGLIHTWEGAGNSDLKKEYAEANAKLDRLDEQAILYLPRFQLCRFAH